jgi:linoleoyl-CoA desaturase
MPTPLSRALVVDPAVVASARRQLHVKAALIITLFVASYATLVWVPLTLPVAVLVAAVFVHTIVALATGVMHDANHGVFAVNRRVNSVFAASADFLGASSWLWRQQHNRYHHHATNVMGVDSDIEQAPFARLAPVQEWKPWHKFQPVYMWFLYGFLILKWVVFGDYLTVWNGNFGAQPFTKKLRVRDVVFMTAGKAVHVGWALVLPMLFHPWYVVAGVYVAVSWCSGFYLAVLFQLAHCVDVADFAAEDAKLTGDDGVRHQLNTTVDISHRSRLARAYAWFVAGGLDFQVEHHLAPRMPHTLYPRLAPIVDELGVRAETPRRTHDGLFAALRSHQRHLVAMSRRPLAA